jgi:hypothetical protein
LEFERQVGRHAIHTITNRRHKHTLDANDIPVRKPRKAKPETKFDMVADRLATAKQQNKNPMKQSIWNDNERNRRVLSELCERILESEEAELKSHIAEADQQEAEQEQLKLVLAEKKAIEKADGENEGIPSSDSDDGVNDETTESPFKSIDDVLSHHGLRTIHYDVVAISSNARLGTLSFPHDTICMKCACKGHVECDMWISLLKERPLLLVLDDMCAWLKDGITKDVDKHKDAGKELKLKWKVGCK